MTLPPHSCKLYVRLSVDAVFQHGVGNCGPAVFFHDSEVSLVQNGYPDLIDRNLRKAVTTICHALTLVGF